MKTENTLRMELGERSYNITVGSGLLAHADRYFKLDRRVLIVTDSNVPREYSRAIAKKCLDARIISFPQGEESKNLGTFSSICKQMLEFGLQRKDAVVAVGGGVCGDMCGFAAATYMRGIDFYNVPTTLLSQVDSSIGGKTAVDFCGVKNILGAFYQPKAVIIDTDTLKTLDERQVSAGKAEIIKMALTSNAQLFEFIENFGFTEENLTYIITEALKIKKQIVEADEREGSIRKILNFGHTFGHGIEASSDYLHGECVALGMIPMCSAEVRARLIPVLNKEGLPTVFLADLGAALDYMRHDKKGNGSGVDAVLVDKIGEGYVKNLSFEELEAQIINNIGQGR